MFRIVWVDSDIATPAALKVEVVSYSWTDRGGPDRCELSVTGSEAALWSIGKWLGKSFVVKNSVGQSVWWGAVDAIDIDGRGFRVGSDLSEMYNRIRVAYTTAGAGGPEDAVTGWAEDTNSQAEFGIRELETSIGDATAEAATNARSRLLRELAWPVGVQSAGASSKLEAKIKAIGWWNRLDWRYYNDSGGRIANEGSPTVAIPVGWGLTDTSVGFSDYSLHDVDAQLGALTDGDRITVTGSPSNSGTHTVTSGASGDKTTYTATTISFDAPDDINDSANGFESWKANSWIRVTGSASNDGYWWVKQAADDKLTISSSITGRSITSGGAGPSVTLEQGHALAIQAKGTSEIPGASVTLGYHGVKLGQSFTVPVGGTSAYQEVGVYIGKVGNPADNLRIQLCTNGAGSPGSVIDTIDVAAGSITAIDTTTLHWFAFDRTVVTLTASTTYWLTFERTGSVDETDYFLVAASEDAYGTISAWTGAAWATFNWRDGVGSIPFALWASEETNTTLSRVATAVAGSDITAITTEDTGIYVNRYDDSNSRGLAALQKLMDMGHSNENLRITATVTEGRMLVFGDEWDWPADQTPVMGEDGVLRTYLGGGIWGGEGILPVGLHMHLAGVPADVGDEWRISPVYVESASYDTATGRISWRPLRSRPVLKLYSV